MYSDPVVLAFAAAAEIFLVGYYVRNWILDRRADREREKRMAEMAWEGENILFAPAFITDLKSASEIFRQRSERDS